MRSGIIRQAMNFDLYNNFNTITYKMFGKNGRVAERDYFLNYNMALNQAKL